MKGANLFLVAAPRSGSTQLAQWIASHAEISLCPLKEPNHFSAHEFPQDYVRESHLNDVNPDRYSGRKPAQFAIIRDRLKYERLFERMSGIWRMEASTSYITCPDAPSLINAYNSKARIILLTRDPIARAISHYRLAIRTGRTDRSLGVELQAEQSGETILAARFLLRPSQWKDGVDRFARCFSQDQVLHLQFAQVFAHPEKALLQIARFLDVSETGFCREVIARNRAFPPRFARLNRLLYQTGAKTWLRRILPKPVKTALKPLYFARHREIPICQKDIAELRNALRAGT